MHAFLSYLAVALLWCVHWLPLPLLRALGWGLGRLHYLGGRERRRVALTNLHLCFPQLNQAALENLARRHFVASARACLDRSLAWWASPRRLERIIRLRGTENLTDAEGRPTLLLAPHFVGLDAGSTMLTLATSLAIVHSRQNNPVFNDLHLKGRLRFNRPILLSLRDGMRPAVEALRRGYPFYCPPDLDCGGEESIFVPFFGVPAVTLTGVSRLARLAGARVVPCITRQTSYGYEVELLPAWENYPGESVEADTAFMNRFIESQVLRMPEQYFWLHQRFKTRPPGEQRYYP